MDSDWGRMYTKKFMCVNMQNHVSTLYVKWTPMASPIAIHKLVLVKTHDTSFVLT